ncbi:MAG: biotin/lipoyl-binding protein [Myxococcales bacterium]|nr:MAG: biotin/lipoyl-binding protein [Myxococcales bacterium]
MSQFVFRINGKPYEVTIDGFERGLANVTVNGETYDVEISKQKASSVKIERPNVVPGTGPQPARVAPQGGVGSVKAPIPGQILAIHVKAGDTVTSGQALCVLEAMKMENEIQATRGGVIDQVHVQQGQSVGEGDPLFTIKE